MAGFCADDDGDLTHASMMCPHLALRTAEGSQLYSRMSLRLRLKLCAIKNLGSTAEELAKIYNPAARQMWGPDGRFDAEVFEALFEKQCGPALVVDGGTGRRVHVLAVTRKGFDAFLKSKSGKAGEAAAPDTACTVFGFVNVLWAHIASGSLDELFALFADCSHSGEPAISKDALRLFYTNPGEAVKSKMKP